jgi:hypothetical protein
MLRFLGILAIIQVGLQTSLLVRGEAYIASTLTVDDTYYYLQTAWYTSRAGFVTFDGINSTNGVQLLWFALLTLIGMVTPTRETLLIAALALCVVLNACCYVIIWKLYTLIRQPALIVLLASFWTFQVLSTRTYLMGMENTLHALLFWCAIWQTTAFLLRVWRRQALNLFGLAVVLVLNIWTRLDSVLFCMLLVLVCAVALFIEYGAGRQALHITARLLASFILLLGLGVGLQLLAFQIMGGSLLPISMIIKGTAIQWDWRSLPVQYIGLALVYSPTPPMRFAAYLPAYEPAIIGIVGLALLCVVALLCWLAFLRCTISSPGLLALRSIWACLLVCVLAYYVLAGQQGPPLDWYLAPVHIFWSLTAALLGALLVQCIAGCATWRKRWLVGGTGMAVVAAGVALFALLVFPARSNMYFIRYQAAHWMTEHTAEESIYAAWNAGQIGFFSERTVINIDGLVNSPQYYRQVLRHPAPGQALFAYLCLHEVDFIVDYEDTGFTVPLPVRHQFPPDPAGRTLRIWQIGHLCPPG